MRLLRYGLRTQSGRALWERALKSFKPPQSFLDQLKKWVSSIGLETVVLALILVSIWLIHKLSDLLLGVNPSLFGGLFPVNYFFDAAHAIAMARYLYRLVRGFLDEDH